MTNVQEPIYSLRVIWACMKKDIKSALSERFFTIVSIIVPVNILILLSLFVLAGSNVPTAVVMNDNGPLAQKFYTAMSHAHSFHLRQTTASQAHDLIEGGRIVAIVTIPADFDSHVQNNQPVQVDVQVNNLNTDFTNDVRRAVPLSITSFYAKAFPNLVTVTPHEIDQYIQDTDYIPYLAVSILAVALALAGTLQSGTSAAREWETSTIKELLLSPASRWAVVVGKMLAAFVMSIAAVLVLLFVLIVIFGIRPVNWGEVIGFTSLSLVIFIAFGTLIGTLFKQRQTATILSIGVSLPLFFMSGAFGPISFADPITQAIARIFPIYYAIVLQQHAFHGFNLDTLGTNLNVLILAAYAVGLILLTTIVLRRSTLAH